MISHWKRYLQRLHTFVVNRITRYVNAPTLTELMRKTYFALSQIFPITRKWFAVYAKVRMRVSVGINWIRNDSFFFFYPRFYSNQIRLILANGMTIRSIAVNFFNRCKLNWEFALHWIRLMSISKVRSFVFLSKSHQSFAFLFRLFAVMETPQKWIWYRISIPDPVHSIWKFRQKRIFIRSAKKMYQIWWHPKRKF